jgi:RES domain
MHFHLSRGQPVMPSRVAYRLFELEFSIGAAMKFADLAALARMGLRTEAFGQLSYDERHQEYPRSQEVAEAIFFLGHAALIVPSARSAHSNLVVFCDRVLPDGGAVVADHGVVDWREWQRQAR